MSLFLKPSGIECSLTWDELFLAAMVGVRRQCQNLERGRKDWNGCPLDWGWQYQIEGACGEAIGAKCYDHFWSGNLGNLQADDVARFQVRTASEHNYRLPIYHKDKDDRAYLLVTGRAPDFVLRGWIWGREGKRQEYWSDPFGGRPAFFVPQMALRPLPPRHAR